MWKVWIDLIHPHMRIDTNASSRMCGLIQSPEATLPVERIGIDLSTNYPQKLSNSHQIHILEESDLKLPYMGGDFKGMAC
jgi:hypothetical protein